MATPKQIAANRLNSLKSTGPRTPAGKAAVSQNRRTHGLLGRFEVYSAEEQNHYDTFVDNLIQDQKPVGLLETELVKKMAQHLWLSQRSVNFQEGCFIQCGSMKGETVEVQALAPLERFTALQAHHDRAFRRTLGDLQTLRKQRQTEQIGFERQKRAEAEEARRIGRDERAKNADRRCENEEFRRYQAAQYRTNRENRQQQLHEIVMAIQNRRLAEMHHRQMAA